MFRRPTAYQLPEISVSDLQTACRGAKATAAGPDCWAPAEWRLLSDKALLRLTQLLNCIEEGGQWPTALQQATSAYLSKDPATHWHIEHCPCCRYYTVDGQPFDYDTSANG